MQALADILDVSLIDIVQMAYCPDAEVDVPRECVVEELTRRLPKENDTYDIIDKLIEIDSEFEEAIMSIKKLPENKKYGLLAVFEDRTREAVANYEQQKREERKSCLILLSGGCSDR
ncbi:MAG: hypothetical protein ACOX1G_05120 [bacterium]|jgi:hypothetical protein